MDAMTGLAGWRAVPALPGRLYQQLRYRLFLLPWPVLLGAVLLLSSVLLLLATLPQRHAIGQLEQEVAQLREQVAARQQLAKADAEPLSPAAFYRFLPPEADAAKLIGRLLEAADRYGVVPERVEYQFARSAAAPFSVYRIVVPAQADYVAIRKFVIRAQNTLPSVALDEVSFKRDEGRDGQVAARLRFSLYMRRR